MDTTLPAVEMLPAADGTPLAVRSWPTDAAQARGGVLIVHGLGEHSGRYAHVARALSCAGWTVTAFDLRGHGLSGGARGALKRPDDHLRDVASVLDRTRAGAMREGPASHLPFVLFGHSMGGLVAAQFVARAVRPVDGLVLSSPALDVGLSWFQRAQLAFGHTFLPDFAQPNRLDVSKISHDPSVVSAYRADPLVHDRITARLARALVDGGAEVLERASGWRVPTLLLWAGADALVSPSGSARFAAAAPAAAVRSRCFVSLYHEIFNESDPAPVLGELMSWLDERFPAV